MSLPCGAGLCRDRRSSSDSSAQLPRTEGGQSSEFGCTEAAAICMGTKVEAVVCHAKDFT